jgi:hypothetical protein
VFGWMLLQIITEMDDVYVHTYLAGAVGHAAGAHLVRREELCAGDGRAHGLEVLFICSAASATTRHCSYPRSVNKRTLR